MYVNGKKESASGGIGNYTVYVNPYMVLQSGGYTKHFYIEGQKIVSKLGGGQDKVNNAKAGDGETAIDYSAKQQEMIESIVKNLKWLGDDGTVLTAGNSGKIPPGQVKGTGNVSENQQYYYHPDHLGSTSYITDSTGEVYQHLEYFAFGETFVEEHSNTHRTPYLFNEDRPLRKCPVDIFRKGPGCREELDEETGLYYFEARMYDPQRGQFLSIDPLADADKNIGMSPYTAMANNPVTYIDPDGRCWQKVGEEYVPCDNADIGATTTGAFGNSWTMTESNGWQLTNGADPSTVDAYYTEQTPDGTAAYYENRYTEHIEKYNTRPPDYYLGYGHKYNVRFNNETRAGLSEAGKEWLDQTTVELQVLMEGALRDNPSIELNNGTFQKFAFESHVPAYSKGDKLFNLGISDKLRIMATPDFRDSFGSGLGRTQIGKILDKQLLFNSFQSSPSSLYNKTKNPAYLRMGGL